MSNKCELRPAEQHRAGRRLGKATRSTSERNNNNKQAAGQPPTRRSGCAFLVARVMPALSAAVDTRRFRAYDENDNDVYVVYFGNSPGGTQGLAPR